MQLSCPVCQAELLGDNRQLRCAQGHSFDAARQGYFNLLLVQRKRSRDPGDNPDMVQARRQFLCRQHYQPLSDAINQLSHTLLSEATDPKILDVGCGEGYYTARLREHLLTLGHTPDMAGLDISKHAIKAATQRSRDIQWLVASAAEMPLPAYQLDLALLLFSRILPAPLAQVLKPGGQLLIAWPGQDHLRQLRERIYTEVHDTVLDVAGLLEPHFSQSEIKTVRYDFTLTGADAIGELLAMTPHGQRLKNEARERILNLSSLTLTLDVNLGVFQRV